MEKRVLGVVLGVVILGLCMSAHLYGETITWTGSKDSNYNNPGNWDMNKVPGIDDDVVIAAKGLNNPVMLQSNQCTSVDIKTGAILTIDARKAGNMLLLEFKDTKDCGFKSNKDSKGSLRCIGDEKSKVLLTTSAEEKPNNYWNFGCVRGFNVLAEHASFWYAKSPIYRATVNLNHCDFGYGKSYQFSLSGSNQIKKMDNCILHDGPGGIYAGSNKTINNMVIEDSITVPKGFGQVITRGKLEFINSNFNPDKVGHMSGKSGLVISKNHNDVSGDYRIWLNRDWKYSSVKNGFTSADNVTIKATYGKDKGKFIINKDAECNNLTIEEGTILVINEGATLTVKGLFNNQGTIEKNGKLIISG